MHISIHTLTQRVTRLSRFKAQPGILFQSTPSRRGWRRLPSSKPKAAKISIHTLTQRVTEKLRLESMKQEISIHTLTQRVTRYGRRPCPYLAHFNPHPHAEGDCIWYNCKGRGRRFQSTPSRRGWLIMNKFAQLLFGISIHTLTQRVTATFGIS